MKPLYDRLLERSFPDSASAVEFCRGACAEHGFTVKQEASANKHIYVYCSREGLPDSVRKPRSSPQRKRPSKRCDCRWRVVLSETEPNRWEFRRSLNPNAAEHNHEMMSPEEMVQNWPNEVNEFIIRLARQRMQTHEIRDLVKQRFPSIAWNERRFYNRLTEERKRIRQRDVMDRSQRLLTASARVCSLVAANEDWSTCVESEFTRLLNHYCQLARTDGKGLVNFDTEAMQIFEQEQLAGGGMGATSSGSSSDDSSQPDDMEDTVYQQQEQQQPEPKRRKSLASLSSSPSLNYQQQKQQQSSTVSSSSSTATAPGTAATNVVSDLPKGTQTVHVPGYTLFVRLQSQRGASEGSSSMHRVGRRNTITSTTEQLEINPLSTSFPLASPGASSSSSSTSTALLHHQYALQQHQQQQQRSPTSPQPPQSISEALLTTSTAATPYQQQTMSDHSQGPFPTPTIQQQQQNNQHHGTGTGSEGGSAPTAAAAAAFQPAYATNVSGNAFCSPSSELSFAFESPAVPQAWDHQQQQRQQQIMQPTNQFESMVMDAKQQAVLFGYMSPDNENQQQQQQQQYSLQQQQQQRTMRLNDPLRHPLPLQIDGNSSTVNNSLHAADQAPWG
ncbi:hypothetical protein BDA99DRAFT_95104 [Phascolomyces articulosus]|uniref:FAR1 domain-containing protein n=1 Tax=Phascolomyces articulosus TaxID=60185 RepID=A0AAD5JXS3_9FUNG|nr:hypothetical protein BDA99DRAFT_95104 [Phascolomyces articulosus]